MCISTLVPSTAKTRATLNNYFYTVLPIHLDVCVKYNLIKLNTIYCNNYVQWKLIFHLVNGPKSAWEMNRIGKKHRKNEWCVLIKLFMYLLINLFNIVDVMLIVDINQQCYRYVRHVITIQTNSNVSHLQWKILVNFTAYFIEYKIRRSKISLYLSTLK
jgi:hypothetical protein